MDGALRQELFAGFAGVVQLAGQYSVNPIVSNEQFLIGGVRSVRGYLEAENLGDIGIYGSFELHAPNLIPQRIPLGVIPYAFFDAGHATFQQPLPGQPASSDLRSYGIGVELAAWKWFFGSLTWSDPLIDGTRTRAGDSRWEFVLRSTW
jgi:hemolysin activation/secretion protein